MSGLHSARDDARDSIISVLEAGRGIAALAVVAHHASQATDAFAGSSISDYFDWGILGVDFFFVLSGFIIFHAHRTDSMGLSRARHYVSKRLTRIFVPYIPVCLAMIVIYLLMPGLSQGNRDWGLFTSLTLLPSSHPPALSVAWTLVFEMVFYIFFLARFLVAGFWWLVGAWAAAILLAPIIGFRGPDSQGALGILLNPLVLEFKAGMVAAVLYGQLRNDVILWALIAGSIGIAVYVCYPDMHSVVFGVSLAPIALGAAMAERRARLQMPQALVLLGSASYAIYLLHNPAQSLIARGTASTENWLLIFFACIVGGVLSGVIYHRAFERPAMKAVRGWQAA